MKQDSHDLIPNADRVKTKIDPGLEECPVQSTNYPGGDLWWIDAAVEFAGLLALRICSAITLRNLE